MGRLFWIGIACWVVAGAAGLWFAYATRDKMTKYGVLWKFLASVTITLYGVVLTVAAGTSSQGSRLFIAGLWAATIGDVIIGFLQYRQNGSVKGLADKIVGQDMNAWQISFGVAGVFFIISYFHQMVAFIKGLDNLVDPSDYVIPFILFALIPPVFAIIGGVLTKFRVLEVPTRIFIIGVFYVLLVSVLFSAASVYAFALFPTDPRHAAYVNTGALFFVASVLFVLLRYANPGKYESKATRFMSRCLTFFGRMILAGCAFML